MKVALGQTHSTVGDLSGNTERMLGFSRCAASAGADVNQLNEHVTIVTGGGGIGRVIAPSLAKAGASATARTEAQLTQHPTHIRYTDCKHPVNPSGA